MLRVKNNENTTFSYTSLQLRWNHYSTDLQRQHPDFHSSYRTHVQSRNKSRQLEDYHNHKPMLNLRGGTVASPPYIAQSILHNTRILSLITQALPNATITYGPVSLLLRRRPLLDSPTFELRLAEDAASLSFDMLMIIVFFLEYLILMAINMSQQRSNIYNKYIEQNMIHAAPFLFYTLSYTRVERYCAHSISACIQ